MKYALNNLGGLSLRDAYPGSGPRSSPSDTTVCFGGVIAGMLEPSADRDLRELASVEEPTRDPREEAFELLYGPDVLVEDLRVTPLPKEAHQDLHERRERILPLVFGVFLVTALSLVAVVSYALVSELSLT